MNNNQDEIITENINEILELAKQFKNQIEAVNPLFKTLLREIF